MKKIRIGKEMVKIGILILLVFSISLNLLQCYMTAYNKYSRLEGTYVLDGNWNDNSEYIVIQKDNSFLRYQNGERIESGKAEAVSRVLESPNMYYIEGTKYGAEQYFIISKDEILYRFCDNELYLYKRIFTYPIFTNY